MTIHRFLPLALLVFALAFAGFAFASPAANTSAADASMADASMADVAMEGATSSEATVEGEASESEAVFPWPETFSELPSVGPGQECLANCVIALQGCLQRCVQPNGSLNPSCVSQCELDFDECSGECNS